MRRPTLADRLARYVSYVPVGYQLTARGVSDVFDVPLSTAHSRLVALVERGALQRTDAGVYRVVNPDRLTARVKLS